MVELPIISLAWLAVPYAGSTTVLPIVRVGPDGGDALQGYKASWHGRPVRTSWEFPPGPPRLAVLRFERHRPGPSCSFRLVFQPETDLAFLTFLANVTAIGVTTADPLTAAPGFLLQALVSPLDTRALLNWLKVLAVEGNVYTADDARAMLARAGLGVVRVAAIQQR